MPFLFLCKSTRIILNGTVSTKNVFKKSQNATPGLTSFAPVIEATMHIVKDSSGLFHILIIITDGQVITTDYHILNENCRRIVEWFLLLYPIFLRNFMQS